MLHLSLFLLAAALFLLPTPDDEPNEPKPVTLIVTVTNLRNDKGNVSALLFASKDGFPDDDKKAARQQSVPIATLPHGKPTLLTFADLPPGEYALILLHDENANGKMDTSFGFPTEGFGASNNPKFGFKPPAWDKSHFALKSGPEPVKISVKMVYL